MSAIRPSLPAPTGLPSMAALALLAACLAGCATTADAPGQGQEVLLAPSIASVSGPTGWSMLIQGRIFEPPEGSSGRQALIDALAPAMGADPTDALYRARAGYFVSDSIRNARISVSIGDRIVPLPPSDPAGCIAGEVRLSNDEVQRLSRDGVITFTTLSTPANATRFPGTAMLVPEDGLIVVTDMDDTIKDTHVLDRTEAKANTFVRPFRPVAGMPELYRAWQQAAGPRIHFHVVSAGPWQFHEPLRRFTEGAGFPAFTWDMRSVDITDPRVLIDETLKADPKRLYDFKVSRIRALMERLPKRHFVLVGDSGERDPEVYATIVSEFPDRVDAVFIRNVTAEGQGAPRYAKLYPTAGAIGKLKVFADPAELPRRLGEAR